jgi:DNA gyrase subunit B
MAKKPIYDESSISILEGLEAVRVRPAMYIGDIGERGLHHLINEVVDNSIDEALAGYCNTINITLNKNGSVTIEDNGRGIPTGKHKEKQISALEVVMCTLHAGGKFEKKAYVLSAGLHGVGVSVVNALSEWLEVEVKREGKIFKQKYEKGIPLHAVKPVGKSNDTGTKITFYPDQKIFKSIVFKDAIISERLQELAYLNGNIKIVFNNLKKNEKKTYRYKGGIVDFVSHLSESKNILHKDPLYVYGESDKVIVELAIQYNTSDNETSLSYVNSVNTIEGGTHLVGMKVGMTRALNEFANSNNLAKKISLTGEDFREGLVAIISVKVPEPQFEGQTKTKLGNNDVKGIVEKIIYEELTKVLNNNSTVSKKIIEKAVAAAEARIAAKRAREATKKKNSIESLSIPTKLADCSSSDVSIRELFLVEGESASGSAKMARTRKFQAIMSLKGKVLNVEKTTLEKILENQEIQSIISAIGCGISSFEPLKLENLRYNKIILMVDADVDGSHIRTLLLTFFYRFMRELIDRGHLYIAQAPLFKIKKGKEEHYAWSENERDRIISKIKSKLKKEENDNITVSRFKGLGEMNPEQLWKTTMDPETRTLLQVKINNLAEAEKIFSICMGEYAEARKDLIEKYADNVRYLDV